MRRIYFRWSCFAAAGSTAVAKPSEHLNFGTQLNAAECNTTGARLVTTSSSTSSVTPIPGSLATTGPTMSSTQNPGLAVEREPGHVLCRSQVHGIFRDGSGSEPGFYDPDANDTVAAG